MANTPNYDLPLLDTSNIPSWLVGWNSAMTTIDLALDGLQEQIDGATGEPITVDSEFSETSENPVQNKVITAYLNQLTARVVALELGTANNIPQWIQGGNGTLSSQTQTVQCTTVASYNPTKLRVLVGENQFNIILTYI